MIEINKKVVQRLNGDDVMECFLDYFNDYEINNQGQ